MKASSSDSILRGMLPDRSVRVVAVTATETTREAARRHAAVGGTIVALGRAASAGLLLATLTKSRERVTMQVLGDGPLGGPTVDSNAQGDVRIFIKNPGVSVPAAPDASTVLAHAVGRNGIVSVVRDLGMRDNFSGQTAIVSGEIDADVEHYLTASEQIDSVLVCDALLAEDMTVRIAGGLLLQALPQSESAGWLQGLREAAREGALAAVLRTLDASADPEALVRACLGDEADDLQVLDTRPVRFSCPCSRERALGSLALLDESDLVEMIAEGTARVTCEFCRERYELSVAELEEVRAAARKRAAGVS